MGEPANGPSASATDQLNIDRLQASLHTRSIGKMLRYMPSTASTNAEALTYLQQHVEPSAPHGLTILAECQTAGRGRRGRDLALSAPGNIYSSVIMVPDPEATAPVRGSPGFRCFQPSRWPIVFRTCGSGRLREMAERSPDRREKARRHSLRTDMPRPVNHGHRDWHRAQHQRPSRQFPPMSSGLAPLRWPQNEPALRPRGDTGRPLISGSNNAWIVSSSTARPE